MGIRLNTRAHGNLGQFPPVPHSRSGESEVQREKGAQWAQTLVPRDPGPEPSRAPTAPHVNPGPVPACSLTVGGQGLSL